MVIGVMIVSSLLSFSFTLTRLNIAPRHYMEVQVALGVSEVIRVSELSDRINNYYPNYHSILEYLKSLENREYP